MDRTDSRWTILSREGKFSLCRCVCGTEKRIDTYSVKYGKSKSCGCLRKETSRRTGQSNRGRFHGDAHHGWTGSGDIPGRYWGNLLRNARNREIEVGITIEEAQELLIRRNRKCALTGRVLSFGSRDLGTETTASLDRIDSDLGYTIENCQWLHKDIQLMKNAFENDYFLNTCREVARWNNSASS